MPKLPYRLVPIAGLGMVFMLLATVPAGASSANLSHSYQSTDNLTNGSIVSLEADQPGYAQLANVNNGSRLLGVVLSSQDSLLAVNSASGKVQVATNGIVSTLVSTVNGPIKVGDQVSVSPFDGIGMEAAVGRNVIGIAQTVLSSNSPGTTTEQVKDKTGQTQQVKVGYIRLNIAISSGSQPASGGAQLNSLQKIAKSMSGQTIPTARIVMSMAVAFVALSSLVSLIYGSIYGSIVSVGRNPLAKSAIFRSLASVMGMAVLTVAVAGVAIFFLLR